MKNSLFKFLIIIISGSWILACEEVPEFELDDTLPVVEAFLYMGDEVDDIKISEVVPFESSVENNEIDGLDIEIIWKGQSYALVNADSGGGKYYYPGDDLEILSGETYEISFLYEGEMITSSTTVPPAPDNLELSTDALELPQLVDIFDIRDLAQSGNSNVNVEWSNPNGDYYYLVIENIESDPEPIDVNDILSFNFEFTSVPTQNDFFTLIPFVHFTQFGTHRIILYRVNEEYALLYETIQQDSRDLNEPYTNIDNGVGIFSGFASDTVYLEINMQ
ncbi:DUF4249 family protein [Chondrinema litorale]|uniref:DUF4249 family protein n=1 Tax=Chondrinema litorale TaxID=2994555 RepID=UPI0025434F1F|nr:DUF4249 family protein [Chondrinema litorale]UZR97368.1 DUF4249 family protein [Chondrinema litorale]